MLKAGAPVPPGAIQPRRLALLAFLAAAGERCVARDRLATLLWPDSDEEKSRRSVAQALYALRRDLENEEAILGVRDLRLNAEVVESDVGDFERHRADGNLERAAALYAGPFLDGFRLAAIPDFERWLDAERVAWAGRHREVVERLARNAEQRGDSRSAVNWWRSALGHDPHNARLTVHLMRALARQGDRAGAIRQAEIYAALVQGELDIAPDPTVLREAEAIRLATTPHEVTAELPVPVSRVPRDTTESTTEPIAHDANAVTTTADPPSLTAALSSGRGRRTAWVVAAAVLGLTAVAVIQWRADSRPAVRASRVLVAPLKNDTGDSTLGLVGTMVAEWITSRLSQTGLVDVIDQRTMLEATSGAPPDASARDFALRAGVGTMVVGSVFRAADHLTFDLRVTDARTGQLRQSIPTVTVPIEDPTAALEPLRQQVMGALAVLFDIGLHNWSAASSQPPTWEAYQEFLVGMREFGTDYDKALRHFERAVVLDSSYWQARLWIGIANANLRRYPPADSVFRSLAGVTDRLAPYDRATLDYFQHGFVHGEWEGSYRGARRMAQLAPTAGHALYALGATATVTGRHHEALGALRRVDLDHGWGVAWASRIRNLMVRNLHMLGRHAEELAVARRMQETEPGAGWVRVGELRALAALRRPAELNRRADAAMALPATETSWEPFSPGDMLLTVARELAAHGDTLGARRYLARAEQWYLSRPPLEARSPDSRRGLARVLYTAGRWPEAAELYGELFSADTSNLEDRASLGLIAAHTGDSAFAQRTIDALLADTRRWRFGAPALWAARIAAQLGRSAEAVALLRRAVGEGHTRTYLVHTDPDFLNLSGFAPLREFLAPRD